MTSVAVWGGDTRLALAAVLLVRQTSRIDQLQRVYIAAVQASSQLVSIIMIHQ